MHARVGMPVDSTAGHWRELDDFVVDPTNWHVTHLVVQPHQHHERSHLVSVDKVGSCGERLTLTLSPDDIDKIPEVEVTEFNRIERPETYGNGWISDAAAVSAWPYTGRFSSTYPEAGAHRYVATKFDHIPDHEVELRRSSNVVTSDEHTVGTVDGFVFDDDGSITHLVLEHGHLWGHREITIPIVHVRRANARTGPSRRNEKGSRRVPSGAIPPPRPGDVMNLALDDDESVLLREILDSTYRDLEYEIADTDNSNFKNHLRTREHHVTKLLDMLGGPLPDRTRGPSVSVHDR